MNRQPERLRDILPRVVNQLTALEPAMHRPRPCPTCSDLSTAIVNSKCLACRNPGVTAEPAANKKCDGCGQQLLINRPGRTHCARCTNPEPAA